jgi:hypothetical protein
MERGMQLIGNGGAQLSLDTPWERAHTCWSARNRHDLSQGINSIALPILLRGSSFLNPQAGFNGDTCKLCQHGSKALSALAVQDK